MNVVFTMIGQIVIDDQRDLLNVDTASQEIGGDEDARRSRTEFAHDNVALLLLHLAVHGRHGKVPLVHLFRQPVDFPARVAENDGLSDTQRIVQIAQRIQFPFLTFNLKY